MRWALVAKLSKTLPVRLRPGFLPALFLVKVLVAVSGAPEFKRVNGLIRMARIGVPPICDMGRVHSKE